MAEGPRTKTAKLIMDVTAGQGRPSRVRTAEY